MFEDLKWGVIKMPTDADDYITKNGRSYYEFKQFDSLRAAHNYITKQGDFNLKVVRIYDSIDDIDIKIKV